MSNGKTFDVTEVGILLLKQLDISFATGDVGYIAILSRPLRIPVSGIRSPATNPASEPLHGYSCEPNGLLPVFYPIESNKYNDLRLGEAATGMTLLNLVCHPQASVLVSVVVSGTSSYGRYPRALGASSTLT